ncbi:methylenetetrahydrofolate reductase C-terminal domain-containing protein [Thermodesulfobacterium sp.]|jgi:ferredoxin|uniref:methylenetetrahydrofolate reductase C-terminal domain-containing protein n=1 Tax=Thermodesulfobacterium sp. TaxID=1965289 RepID=UPI00257AE4FF|nr:methylenetetrahydrofolate reductase C-terminal domain-containing protein [Thermodesulfobacterium sp.]MBZ4682129.1 hypothetical protein [Thermodesulfobacterium sp.]
MVITELKPIEKIWQNIADFRKVLVLGCRGCSGICSTGGDREVKLLVSALNLIAENEGKNFIALGQTLIRQCDPVALKVLPEFLKEVEAVVSLACGVGVNLIADLYPDLKVYPGTDTLFIGAHVGFGVWEEKCRACGDCFIDKTAGLCPIARCPKGLLNGPCGGSQTERCEVNPEIPCVWYEIIIRLEKRGELASLDEIIGPKDWRPAFGEGPKRREREDLTF